MFRTTGAVLWVASATTMLTLMLPCGVQADDFDPPPWRGSPLTTLYEWDFDTETNPLSPDGDLTTVLGDDPFHEPLAMIEQGLVWNDGGWEGFGSGGAIEFVLPNWVDTMPYKYVWIQMTFDDLEDTGQVPTVAYMAGYDTGTSSPITSVELTEEVAFGDTQLRQWWTLWPNPDWEKFAITIPPGLILDQVVIDTISTPEPSTLILACLSGLGLIVYGWRRSRLVSKQ